jgi:hypothetical protein
VDYRTKILEEEEQEDVADERQYYDFGLVTNVMS